jgi:hypothetical protein
VREVSSQIRAEPSFLWPATLIVLLQ